MPPEMRKLLMIMEGSSLTDGGRELSPDLDVVVTKATKQAREALSHHLNGSFMPFTVKVKPFKGHRTHWIALYRNASQFSKSGAIFWINERSLETAAEAGVPPHRYVEMTRDSILHEYGHVLAEWAGRYAPDLATAIRTKFPDEEDFAEGFAQTLGDGSSDDNISEIAGRYVEALLAKNAERSSATPKPTLGKRPKLDTDTLSRVQAEGCTAAEADRVGNTMRGADAAMAELGYNRGSLEGFEFRVAYDRTYWQ